MAHLKSRRDDLLAKCLAKRRWVKRRHLPGDLLKLAQERFKPFCDLYWAGMENAFWELVFPRLSGLWWQDQSSDSQRRRKKSKETFPPWFHDDLAYACWERFLLPFSKSPTPRQRRELIAYLQTLLLVEAVQLEYPDLTFVIPPYQLGPGMRHWTDDLERKRNLVLADIEEKFRFDKLRSLLAKYIETVDLNKPKMLRLKEGIYKILPRSGSDETLSEFFKEQALGVWRPRALRPADEYGMESDGGRLGLDIDDEGNSRVSLAEDLRDFLKDGTSPMMRWWPLPNVRPIAEKQLKDQEVLGLRLAQDYESIQPVLKELIHRLKVLRRRRGAYYWARRLERERKTARTRKHKTAQAAHDQTFDQQVFGLERVRVGSRRSITRYDLEKATEEAKDISRMLEDMVANDLAIDSGGQIRRLPEQKILAELAPIRVIHPRVAKVPNERSLVWKLLSSRYDLSGRVYFEDRLRSDYLPLLHINAIWAELCICLPNPLF